MSPLRYRALLFDLDGTLVDSSADLAASVNHILREEGLAALETSEVLTMVGDGAPTLLARAFRRRDATPPDDGLVRFRAHYDRHGLDTTRAYQGVPELLRRLTGQRPRPAMAVVTNKPQAAADIVVEGLGLAPWIDAVVGPELVEHRKPDPRHVLAALERLGHPPEAAVMVGDAATDVLAGKRAGAVSVAVAWGFRSRRELEALEPDHLVTSVAELAELLLGD